MREVLIKSSDFSGYLKRPVPSIGTLCHTTANMRAATTGFLLTVLLALGADAYYYDYAANADYQADPRRTKVQLHLDKDNPNDVEFAREFTDVLKNYHDVKLETEHVALRNDDRAQVDDDAGKLVAEKLVKLLVENPQSQIIAIRTRSEPQSKHSHHDGVVSYEAPEESQVRQDHAGRCRC